MLCPRSFCDLNHFAFLENTSKFKQIYYLHMPLVILHIISYYQFIIIINNKAYNYYKIINLLVCIVQVIQGFISCVYNFIWLQRLGWIILQKYIFQSLTVFLKKWDDWESVCTKNNHLHVHSKVNGLVHVFRNEKNKTSFVIYRWERSIHNKNQLTFIDYIHLYWVWPILT